jgi:hypothetical protein
MEAFFRNLEKTLNNANLSGAELRNKGYSIRPLTTPSMPLPSAMPERQAVTAPPRGPSIIMKGSPTNPRGIMTSTVESVTYQAFFFEIDPVSRKKLMERVSALGLGTPRTVVKKTLGRPSHERSVAFGRTPGGAPTIGTCVTYYLKAAEPTHYTPEKDERVVLTFDQHDLLVSLTLDEPVPGNAPSNSTARTSSQVPVRENALPRKPESFRGDRPLYQLANGGGAGPQELAMAN